MLEPDKPCASLLQENLYLVSLAAPGPCELGEAAHRQGHAQANKPHV